MREKQQASNDLYKQLSQKYEEAKVELAAGTTFDIEILKKSKPEGVPAAEKEKYLSDAQFAAAFKMSR